MKTAQVEKHVGHPAVTRVEPPRGWLVLDFRELWEYRELLYFFIWKNIKIRYKQTLIGAAWAVIQPLSMMALLTVIFGLLARLPSEGLPYPVFHFSALLIWLYFANSLTLAANTMVDNQHIITKIYFPRVFLPLSAVLSGLLDFCIAFLILAALMLYYKIMITWKVVFLLLFLFIAFLTALGVGLWLSALNALYRDVKHAMAFLVQFWMFASPVAYPSSLVPEKWQWLYGLNPMAGVIDGFRWALVGTGKPPDVLLLASAIGVLCIFLGGIVFFQRIGDTIADRV
jgi:lipopolysaccharide transport system permease protein